MFELWRDSTFVETDGKDNEITLIIDDFVTIFKCI